MSRTSVAFVAAAVAVAIGVSATVWLRADDAPPAPPAPGAALAAASLAGEHIRIDGPAGPIHVWRPAGYHADGAATVVYVHGFYVDADKAWNDYRLGPQFALSGLNATFIMPEAPSGAKPAVMYPNLGALVRLVEQRTGWPRGAGPLVAIGHSGAFRTLRAWLDEPTLDHLVLYDAMYGELDEFADWYRRSPAHRLIVVGDDTVRWTEDLARDLSTAQDPAVVIDRFPDGNGDGNSLPGVWPDRALHARLVYVRSQYGHMPLVTGGVALPLTLRLLPVEILAGAPWNEPLGVLPPPVMQDAGAGRQRR